MGGGSRTHSHTRVKQASLEVSQQVVRSFGRAELLTSYDHTTTHGELASWRVVLWRMKQGGEGRKERKEGRNGRKERKERKEGTPHRSLVRSFVRSRRPTNGRKGRNEPRNERTKERTNEGTKEPRNERSSSEAACLGKLRTRYYMSHQNQDACMYTRSTVHRTQYNKTSPPYSVATTNVRRLYI